MELTGMRSTESGPLNTPRAEMLTRHPHSKNNLQFSQSTKHQKSWRLFTLTRRYRCVEKRRGS
jgi:hypothetical protein